MICQRDVVGKENAGLRLGEISMENDQFSDSSRGLTDTQHEEVALDGFVGPGRWANVLEVEGCLPLAVQCEMVDEEKLLIIRSLLGITSLRRSVKLQVILKDFYESEWRDKEEDHRLRRSRKWERELRNLQSSVNYDCTMVLAGTSGAQGGV